MRARSRVRRQSEQRLNQGATHALRYKLTAEKLALRIRSGQESSLGGARESFPALQRWETGRENSSPGGTTEFFHQSLPPPVPPKVPVIEKVLSFPQPVGVSLRLYGSVGLCTCQR